jgi:hypothetical protein
MMGTGPFVHYNFGKARRSVGQSEVWKCIHTSHAITPTIPTQPSPRVAATMESYRLCLRFDPGHAGAAYNLMQLQAGRLLNPPRKPQ